jgi:chemotaxis protein MotA
LDFATIIGLLIGFGAIFFAGYIGGTDPSIVFGRYEAIILILFGTLGATLTSFPMRIFIRGFFGGFKTAFVEVDYHERDVISTLVSFAEKARREGLLALENEAAALDDEFMRKGIQLVIDGRDTEIIRKVLETEVSNTQEKGGKAEAVFTCLGGYSPTLGII